MKITCVRSDQIYKKIIAAKEKEEKEDIYRYELMKSFEKKWACVGIPLKAEQQGGYDVVASSAMGGGYKPGEMTKEQLPEVEQIADPQLWKSCVDSIRNVLQGFEQHNIPLKVDDYLLTILLNDKTNSMSKLTGDYCGDGGIPGYIIGTIIPNHNSMKMLPVALSHEANHNVRWQYQPWNSSITLADLIISEGLAETQAATFYGEDKIGIWVKNTTPETLHNKIKPLLTPHLAETNFQTISSYLYGDEIMTLRGADPQGIPYCAGYAYGYARVKDYLRLTGKTIYEATITPTKEILSVTSSLWM